ncbi:MAG: response regulator [Methanotrichaceae archaeon]
MSEDNWQILFVDDEPDVCTQIDEGLNGEVIGDPERTLRVKTCTDFNKALEILETHRFDLIILDVRLGDHSVVDVEDEAGIQALDAIKQRRFMPVIFYTNLPKHVQHLETPDVALIRVVEKTDGIPALMDMINQVISTSIPDINRALIRHVESVQRDYMWTFLPKHWDLIKSISDRTTLAYLLSRRLAISLPGPNITKFSCELGESSPKGHAKAGKFIHPMLFYIMPPVIEKPLAGDIYSEKIDGRTEFWVLLTPSCDIVQEKAEFALMAHCNLLTEQNEFLEWKESNSNNKRKILEDLIKNNRKTGQSERYHFLPGALDIPDLIVDFQKTRIIEPRILADNTGTLKRRASLDSPFAEALVARFSRYFGRLGTPDLDLELILGRLRT